MGEICGIVTNGNTVMEKMKPGRGLGVPRPGAGLQVASWGKPCGLNQWFSDFCTR